jgi:MoaA/NifB/PqqE/SkfB family radical SAM enzyme
MHEHSLPPAVALYITSECQFRCRHCFFAQNGLLGHGHLSFDRIKRAIEQLAEGRVILAPLSGGDPLLHPDFSHIVSCLREHSIGPLLGITGVDVGLSEIQKIQESGLTHVQMSMDGLQKETDFLRGNGSYERIEHSLKNLMDSGIHVAVAICIHRDNKEKLFSFVHWLYELGVASIKLQFWRDYGAMPSGIYALGRTEVLNIIEQAADFNQTVSSEFVHVPFYEYDNICGKFIEIKARYPDIVVNFDGCVRVGELGEFIFTVEDNIQTAYANFVQEKQEAFFENLEKEIQEKYNVCITPIDRSAIQSSALIFEFGEKHNILIDEMIGGLRRLFLILHECAHLHQKTLRKNPRHHFPDAEEVAANLWALEEMSSFLSRNFIEKAKKIALQSEDALFNYIQMYGGKEMIGVWEDKKYDQDSSASITNRITI